MIDINKKYRTRNGYKARVICVDRIPPHSPVIAIIGDDEDRVHSFSADGVADHCSPACDLIEVREPREFSIVVSTPANKHYRDKPVVDGQATDELDNGVQPVGNWEVIRVREVIEP